MDFSHCLYREDHDQPASSYIMRSEATGTRTVVNHNALPEMSIREFERVAGAFSDAETWWHFEVFYPPFFLSFLFWPTLYLHRQRGREKRNSG